MARLFPFRSETETEAGTPRVVGIEDERADAVFSALASETAREIYATLDEQPGTSSDVAEIVDSSVQNVSYHLEKLEDAELIEVVDTWYSSRGKEMNVYATADSPLIVAGDRSTAERIKAALSRYLGGIAVLAGGSVLAYYGFERVRDAIPGLATDDDSDDAAQPADDGDEATVDGDDGADTDDDEANGDDDSGDDDSDDGDDDDGSGDGDSDDRDDSGDGDGEEADSDDPDDEGTESETADESDSGGNESVADDSFDGLDAASEFGGSGESSVDNAAAADFPGDQHHHDVAVVDGAETVTLSSNVVEVVPEATEVAFAVVPPELLPVGSLTVGAVLVGYARLQK